jgi:RNA polymerase sigma-70 factor (ECF subfamily)
MAGGEEADPTVRAVTYCLLPRALAPRLHEGLRRHFAEDPDVEVIVERRVSERRQPAARRVADQPVATDRRRIRNGDGQRVAERRSLLLSPASRSPPLNKLPRRARAHAAELRFVERLEPARQQLEDEDTARLITRIQGGDHDSFHLLYLRYFDRVYTYLRVLLKDVHEAEDLTQQVFLSVLQALPRYEHRRSFWVWLVVVLRNEALNSIRQRGRVELTDPSEIDRRREGPAAAAWEGSPLRLVADRELVMFVERLPFPQRQVLLLRYLFDLGTAEIAELLERSPADVRLLQHRALTSLRTRLSAVGRDSGRARPVHWRRLVVKAHVLRSRRAALVR